MSPTDVPRALVFDMDGVLIDSEPLWRRAEIELFGRVGLSLSEADCIQTQGLRIDEVTAFWYARAPWPGPSPDAMATQIVERMVELIQSEGEPIEGVRESLDHAADAGWQLGLASSSSLLLIETVLDRFDLGGRFACVCSAEHVARGKPHPDVYLAALEGLGVEGRDAVAVEDSAHGMASALAAGMRCVAIPPAETRDDPRFEAATWRLDALADLPDALPEIDTARRSP